MFPFEKDGSQWGKCQRDRPFTTVRRNRFGVNNTKRVADVAAAVVLRVRIQSLMVDAWPWRPNSVVMSGDGSKVADTDNHFVPVMTAAQEREYRIFGIVGRNPLEA